MDTKIIRAGFKSNAFYAGSAYIEVEGMFCKEDCEDIIALLEMTIKVIKRQFGFEETSDISEVAHETGTP